MVERCAAAPWSPLPVRFGPRQAGVRTDETASLLAPVRDCCAVSTPTSAGRSSGSREGSGTMNVALRGSSIARRGVGLGTAASPGTRASGGARPTGGAFSVEASSDEGPSWVEHRSTRRRLGHCGESRTAGVGRSPTHGGVFSANASDGEDLRGSSNSSTRRWLGHCGESRNAGVGSRLLDGHALREVPRLVPPAASLNFASLHEPKLACAASRARTRSLHCDRLRKIARLVVSTHAPRAHEFRPKHLTRPSTPSFDGHALCQVTRFIHIRPPGHCRVIRQQLQRHHVQDRGQFAVVFR